MCVHPFKFLVPAWLLFAAVSPASMAAPSETRQHSERTVSFSHRDGTYRLPDMIADFGNAKPPPGRDFATIRNRLLEVDFRKGHKVTQTGLALHVQVPERPVYEVSFRLKYPENFEPGMHGKMIGMSGGRGYDGGRGEEARENGDGWSIRFQFDAREKDIRKSLYVYQSQMTGRYGGPMDAKPFFVQRGEWHTYRLRVTMQSNPGKADGRIEVWCDDEKRVDLDAVRFVTKESGRHINRIRLELFPGGGGITPTRSHTIQIDDFAWKSAETR